MIRRPCSKCGTVDFPKYTRCRIVNSKIRIHTSAHCILCEREDVSLRNAIRYERHKKEGKRYKQVYKPRKDYLKKYEIKNADKIKIRKQEYYLKNKESILAKNKAWKAKNRTSQKTGIPHPWVSLNKAMITVL